MQSKCVGKTPYHSGGGDGRSNILYCLCTHLSVAISSRKSDINNFTHFLELNLLNLKSGIEIEAFCSVYLKDGEELCIR